MTVNIHKQTIELQMTKTIQTFLKKTGSLTDEKPSPYIGNASKNVFKMSKQHVSTETLQAQNIS